MRQGFCLLRPYFFPNRSDISLSCPSFTTKKIVKYNLPLDGLSEYLVQKTHAGQSCPLGPFTIPGGTSSSFLPSLVSSPFELLLDELVVLLEDECLDDKSTG